MTATDDEGDTASAAVTVTVLEPVPALPGLVALLLGGLLLMGGARRLRRGTAQAPGGAGAAIRAVGGGLPGQASAPWNGATPAGLVWRQGGRGATLRSRLEFRCAKLLRRRLAGWSRHRPSADHSSA